MVDFAACGKVSFGQNIQGGATVRVASSAGSISGGGQINDSGTNVTDRGLARLAGLEALEALDLIGTAATGKGKQVHGDV